MVSFVCGIYKRSKLPLISIYQYTQNTSSAKSWPPTAHTGVSTVQNHLGFITTKTSVGLLQASNSVSKYVQKWVFFFSKNQIYLSTMQYSKYLYKITWLYVQGLSCLALNECLYYSSLQKLKKKKKNLKNRENSSIIK